MYLEICLIIFGIAVLLLLIFCIPILLQTLRTATNIATTLETLNQSLPSILKNLDEITTNINSASFAVNREVQNFTNTVGRFQFVIQGVVDDIQNIAPMAMKLPVYEKIKNILAVIKGVRVFMEVLLAKDK
jgi:uncharacterized protein YoxC